MTEPVPRILVVDDEPRSESRAAFSGVDAISKAARADVKDVDADAVRLGLEQLV